MSDVKITLNPKGNLRVEGIPLYDNEGNLVETREGKPFYICRCGQSQNMPFCDSTHGRIGWDGGQTAG